MKYTHYFYCAGFIVGGIYQVIAMDVKSFWLSLIVVLLGMVIYVSLEHLREARP